MSEIEGLTDASPIRWRLTHSEIAGSPVAPCRSASRLENRASTRWSRGRMDAGSPGRRRSLTAACRRNKWLKQSRMFWSGLSVILRCERSKPSRFGFGKSLSPVEGEGQEYFCEGEPSQGEFKQAAGLASKRICAKLVWWHTGDGCARSLPTSRRLGVWLCASARFSCANFGGR